MQRQAPALQGVLMKYADIFADELGTMQPFRVTLQVREDAKPRFCKARSVPFATKEAIEAELDRLESCGILEKVDYSLWAAPIVAVPKKDRNIRICCDYKVTVNQSLEVDQYPLPKPDELFASLAGGQKFTKLDLSQAYQQLLLDAESRQYVTINTHRGLYQYTRLPFGIASSPAIFQKTMDTILQGLPNVFCYIDDILITGPDDDTHLRNLTTVLERLQRHGVRMKKAKCRFMAKSVIYLGHKIDSEGLHTTTDKVDAVCQCTRTAQCPTTALIPRTCELLSQIPSKLVNSPAPTQFITSEEYFLELDSGLQTSLQQGKVLRSGVYSPGSLQSRSST